LDWQLCQHARGSGSHRRACVTAAGSQGQQGARQGHVWGKQVGQLPHFLIQRAVISAGVLHIPALSCSTRAAAAQHVGALRRCVQHQEPPAQHKRLPARDVA
jgi:hypothetical protein